MAGHILSGESVNVMSTVFHPVTEDENGVLYQLATGEPMIYTLQQAIDYGLGEYLVKMGYWSLD